MNGEQQIPVADSNRNSAGETAADAPILSPFMLMRKRFFGHKLAVVSAFIVVLFYVVVAFADFIAYSNPRSSSSQTALVPPQQIHWFSDGTFSPHVYGFRKNRNEATFGIEYVQDPTVKIPIAFFEKGYEYKLLGFIPTNRHLLGTPGFQTESSLFLLGSDELGRDLFSRLVLGIRTSLLIGLAAVAVSISLGMIMGAISGYYGGTIDLLIQRLIEVLRSVPTIPLWMGLAAAIPPTWSVIAVYFAVTIIISLIGWTQLARELRGRVMSLRSEDFVLAAELSGASTKRIIFIHILPLTLSHIIASTTLAIPTMIASETALGYLGLGLRPPVISLGILLNDANSMQNIAMYSWLLWPAIPTAIIILAFNFLGDGLRDAADPYT